MKKGVLIAVGVIVVVVWLLTLAPNFGRSTYVYVDESKSFSNLYAQLKDSAHCRIPFTFRFMAALVKYPGKMQTGRYEVSRTMGNFQLLRHLAGGHQTATRITFNNIRLRQDLANRLSEQLMMSADDIMTLFKDSLYCDSLGFTTETINAMFIPNTYEVYWNITPRKLMSRMKKEYDAFWNPSRLAKAKAMGLTPIQVSILASIVEEETASPDEYSMVAGVYLNRMKQDMPLQADPTIKFAIGDFSIKRILYEYLQVESPYNTYKNKGLPPGPLRTPSIKTIDAVLNYTHHDYVYMCAKDDFSGRHNYARTLAEHHLNAVRYQAALDARQIR